MFFTFASKHKGGRRARLHGALQFAKCHKASGGRNPRRISPQRPQRSRRTGAEKAVGQQPYPRKRKCFSLWSLCALWWGFSSRPGKKLGMSSTEGMELLGCLRVKTLLTAEDTERVAQTSAFVAFVCGTSRLHEGSCLEVNGAVDVSMLRTADEGIRHLRPHTQLCNSRRW
jgi:hypothetical protein